MADKIRAYIAIGLTDGKVLKYANKTIPAGYGVSEKYYSYGDTRGDSFNSLENGDTYGKIRFDFNKITTAFTATSAFKDYITFPELGDTKLLTRINQSQTVGFTLGRTLVVGDSLIIPYTRTRVPAGSITYISVVEDRKGDSWFN